MQGLSAELDRLRRIKKKAPLKLPQHSQHWVMEVEPTHAVRLRDIVDRQQQQQQQQQQRLASGVSSSYMVSSSDEAVGSGSGSDKKKSSGRAIFLFTESNCVLGGSLPPEFIKYLTRQFYLPYACRDIDWCVSKALAQLAQEAGGRIVVKIAASPKELEPALANLLHTHKACDGEPLFELQASASKGYTHLLQVVFSKEESLFRWGCCTAAFAAANMLTNEALAGALEISRSAAAAAAASASDSKEVVVGGGGGEEQPVCRAYYKVMEVFEQTFPLMLHWPLPDKDTCISCDVGASPGGWTQILSRYSAKVVSIDPGLLHPNVLALPNVIYIGTTLQNSNVATVLDGISGNSHAGLQKLKLIVCDVNFEPRETAAMLCSHILNSLDGLGDDKGACMCAQHSPSYVVLTLKLMKKPQQHNIDKISARVFAIFCEASGAHSGCWKHSIFHLTANSKNERTLILRLH